SGGVIMVGGVDTTNGATLTGSTTSWNALPGNGLGDTFNGGTGQFSPFIALQGDVFGVGAGPATVNLAAGHSSNHIDVYGTVGGADGAGGVLNYTPVPNSITSSGAFLFLTRTLRRLAGKATPAPTRSKAGSTTPCSREPLVKQERRRVRSSSTAPSLPGPYSLRVSGSLATPSTSRRTHGAQAQFSAAK